MWDTRPNNNDDLYDFDELGQKQILWELIPGKKHLRQLNCTEENKHIKVFDQNS